MSDKENSTLFEKEERVRSLIKKDNGTELFIQSSETKFTALTYNPTHKETFKLYEEERSSAQSLEQFLDNLYEYLTQTLKSQNRLNYTVTWYKKGCAKFSSYFAVSDLEDLSEKFYINKNKHDYIIEKIELSPIS